MIARSTFWGLLIVMLDLAYSNDVPAPVRDILEHHARSLGLPLSSLEAVGGDLDVAERFIVACETGQGLAFMDAVDSGTAWSFAVRHGHDVPASVLLHDGSVITA